MIYINYFIISTIVCLFVKQNTSERRTFSLFVVLFLTFVFIGFSYPAGGDWIGYFNNYNCQINKICYSSFTLFEPGYQLLVNIAGHLGFFAIIITTALINVFLLYKFSKNFNHSALIILMIMCLFLWGMFTEAIRQGIAFCIILYAVSLLHKGSIYKYLLMVLLASLFHITAIICLTFVLPYVNKLFSRITILLLISFGVTFFIIPTQILQYVLPFLPAGSNTSIKLDFYLNSDAYRPQISVGLGLILDIVLLVVIYISNKRIKKYQLYTEYRFYLATLLGVGVYITFAMLVGRMMPVLTRVGWYGFPMVLMLIYVNIGESIFYKAYSTQRRKKINAVVIFILFYFLLQPLRPFTYEHSRYGIIHQKTIFQKSSELDDKSLIRSSYEKCSIYNDMGYGYLCN